MQKNNAIERWVEHLNLLAPVQGLIHVGAGASIANTFYAEWPLPQVLLIEADESSAAKLLHATEQRTGWVVSNSLVSSKPEACDFYIASNINESGLIAPELLTHLWKNLKAKEVRSLQTTPLSALITQQMPGANWLVIESLAALDVLKSAAEQLNQFDVICVRALRNPLSADLKESSQEAVHRYLVESAFTLLQVEEEVQPNVINLLYARDWKKIHGVREAQLTAQLAERETQAALEAEAVQRLLAEEVNKNAKLLQAEKEAHHAVVAELKAQIDGVVNQHQKAIAEKEAQAKSESEKTQALLAEEANKYTKLLQVEKEAHHAVVAELKAQIDSAVNQHQKAVAEKEAQAKSESEKTQALLAEEANKNAKLLQAEKEAHQAAVAELKQQINETVIQHQKVLAVAESKSSVEAKALAENALQAKADAEKALAILRDENKKLAALVDSERDSCKAKLNDLELKSAQSLALKEQEKTGLFAQITELQKILNDQTISFQKTLEEKTSLILNSLKDQVGKLDKMDSGIKHQLKTAAQNTVKQLEAFWSIQSYFDSSACLPELHGWPISPDVGLALISLIDTSNYDLIIEFGSGSSTELMARALLTKHLAQNNRQSGALLSIKSELNEQKNILPNIEVDLPARIVSFDHHAEYFSKTKARLEKSGLHAIVDLVHAPLVSYKSTDGRDFLYYKCEEKIKMLERQLSGRKANILVLVDGPPGATNPHARYPAFELLMNYLSEHKMSIVMDDYARQEEKEIVEQWTAYAIKRSIAHSCQEIPAEKGMAIFKVN
jgi:hypothetical protein